MYSGSVEGETFDEKYFKDIIAKIIIWKSTEKLINKQKIPGYRANIVTYTLALISYLVQGRLDFMEIWKQQDISEELAEIITWKGLNMKKSPIGILNVNGYYNELINFFNVMNENNFASSNIIKEVIVSDSPDYLVKNIIRNIS